MKAKPICKELEENYIFLFEKAGCEVKLDDEGIHASATEDKIHILDGIFLVLAECHVPHSVCISPDGIKIIVRERYFKED